MNQSEPHNHATHEKREPAKTQCFRRFCGRGRRTWSRLPPRVLLPGGERPAPTEAGAETGAVACVPPARTRPTTRTAGGPAGAPRCQILPHTNEKVRYRRSDARLFLAGAEGLEPSARGFGVDVGGRTRERKRAGVARFLSQVLERAVLVWCCEKTEAKTGRKTSLGHLKIYGRLNKERTKLSR